MSILNLIKTKKIRVALIFIALSGPLLLSPLSLAKDHQQQGMKESRKGDGNHLSMMKHQLKRMAKKLDLSQAQREQIKAIAHQAKVDGAELKLVMKEFKEKNKVLMQEESFNETAFLLLHQEYQNTLSNIALIKAKTKHAIFQVLTDEQKTKWRSLKQQRGHKD